MKNIDYMGDPMDGLLYDAERGSTTSTRLIYEYFCNATEQGELVPGEVAKFVVKQFRAVLAGEITPAKMFRPACKKVVWTGLSGSAMVILRPGRDFLDSVAEAAKMTGIPEGTVREHYYKYKARAERISEVTMLIRKRKVTRGTKARQKINDRLDEIYTSKLD